MKSRYSFLRLLTKTKNAKRRKCLIEKATKKELNQIRNMCFHICRGRYNFPSRLRKKIISHKKVIRDLANPKKLKSKKGLQRRLLKGGFLPALVPVVLGLLSSVGGKLIERAISK